MSIGPQNVPASVQPRPHRPFRAAVFRGLGGFIPPLLTVVVILWVFGTVDQYVLGPVELGTTKLIAKSLEQYLLYPAEGENLQWTATINGKPYKVRESGPENNRDYYVDVDAGRYYWLPADYKAAFVSEDKYKLVLHEDGAGKVKGYTGYGLCYR